MRNPPNIRVRAGEERQGAEHRNDEQQICLYVVRAGNGRTEPINSTNAIPVLGHLDFGVC
jgi:hypothetical protein